MTAPPASSNQGPHAESPSLVGHAQGELRLRVLRLLCENGEPLRLRDAAQVIDRKPSTIGTILGRLVSDGMAERAERGRYQATEAGRAHVARWLTR